MPEKQSKNNDTAQPYPQAQPSVHRESVLTLESERPSNEADSNHKPSKGRRIINSLQTYSQIILSVLTLFVWVVMIFQWDEMRASRKLEYRAYAAVKGVRLDRITGNAGLLTVVYINTGRTPGKDAQIVAISELRETDIPEDAVPIKADKLISKVVLAPQVDFELNVGTIPMAALPPPAQPTETGSENKKKGKVKAKEPLPAPVQAPAPPTVEIPRNLKYYLWGIIEYTDIFDQPHKTKFCFYNIPGTPGWNACASYNSFN